MRFGVVLWLAAWGGSAVAALSDARKHPLELEALSEPERVLAQLTPLIEEATQRAAYRELAMLELAHANACRVVANWNCQREAGAAAREAAERAKEPHLAVRGLIAESRGRILLQDFREGEKRLGEAEAILARTPDGGLLADIMLAYSSLALQFGRHTLVRDYADRGLAALGEAPTAAIRSRLLRNRGRALFELGEIDGARASMLAAFESAKVLGDPKLSAELDLELARIARGSSDLATQRASGQRVLAMAERFKNDQFTALGHEVIGLAARQAGDLAEAETSLSTSEAAFGRVGLATEQRRVLRDLVRVKLEREPRRNDLEPLMRRLMDLDEMVDRRDRARAGEDFDARMRYAEQDFALQKLAKESELAGEREKTLRASNHLRLLLVAISIAALSALALFLIQQRRANRRLTDANTKLQESEHALENSEKRLRAVTDNIPAIISHVDRDQRYTFVNAFMARMFGSQPDDLLGTSVRQARGEQIYATLAPHIDAALRGEASNFEGQADLGGRTYHYQTSYIPERDREGEVCGFFAMTFDITRLKLAEQQLEREARFDALTGVANRRHFEERLSLAVARGRRQQVALAVLYLDIDHLKHINDRFGHTIGDVVIRAFATRLSFAVREGDLVARLGGDEFVVLSEHVESAHAIESAERTAHAVIAAMAEPVIAADTRLHIGTSIGIAVTSSVSGADALIADADRALYEAKAAGRNTWRRANTGLH